MKTAVLDGILDLPGLVAVYFYDTNPVHLISMCCNSIEWIQKTQQVYDPETKMVRDAHLFRLNVNDSYNYNMNLVDLRYQLWNVYRVDYWMRK